MDKSKLVVYADYQELPLLEKGLAALPEEYCPFHNFEGKIGLNYFGNTSGDNRILLSPLGTDLYLGTIRIPSEATDIKMASVQGLESSDRCAVRVGASFKLKGIEYILYRNDVKFRNP